MMRSRSFLMLAASLTALAAPTVPSMATEDAVVEDDVHRQLGTEIIVTAPYQRDRFLLSTAAGVLEGEALSRETRPTLGETLARQPGVSSSFFGPNASRPILRGFDAERVRILTDGIGSFDVSNMSADHAVAINPLTADRVEVVRGPATLLFGSSAIGGVVNVTDRRIAREIPEEWAHIDATGTLGTAADERGGAATLDVPLGRSGLVAHADGSYLKTGDYRTGGFIFSRELREEAAEAGGEVAEEAPARGRVGNSDVRTWEAAGGLSWIGDGGSLGFSVSRLESNYGVPASLDVHGHEEEHGEGEEHEEHSHDGIRLDMRQTRVDARAEVPMSGAFERLQFRFGFAGYRHDELEPPEEDGTRGIGTSFFNDALEARLELVQAQRGAWRGAVGAQYLTRRFEAVGEEAYIPLNLTEQFGLFTLQSFDLGLMRAEVGGRFERTEVGSTAVGIERRFNAVSGSAGVSVGLGGGFRLAGSVSYTERAPAAEEMFANGPHAATGSFEAGDPSLRKERAVGVEALLRGRGAGWRLEVSGFYTRFRNFIFLSPNGEEDEGLPVFEYLQAGARYWGAEAEAAVTLAEFGDTRVEATGLADFVRADLLGGRGPVPRIPPLRFLGGVEASGGRVGGRVEVEHVTRQDRVAAFETETPGFTLVNASLSFRPFGPDNSTAIIASVNNIFDVEARRHSSFLKSYAPLPGRDARLAVRLSF